jgi:hypothetical protein
VSAVVRIRRPAIAGSPAQPRVLVRRTAEDRGAIDHDHGHGVIDAPAVRAPLGGPAPA